ncbi:hypothetical protein [Nostoc sp. TCL26-01]|uniref:hypothetical protein n=1 Tax=Nostoc sp. TCL26-01 TaxID=2576904 RepID=UPI0015BA5EE1|nr:hypothetical protein [Nostoc sp. TCL26-01]QLE59818.1 hypothetical protein FD725_30770 [Nostoc sp. TCL26-01]
MTATFEIFFQLPRFDEHQGHSTICWVADSRLQRHLDIILQRDPELNEAALALIFLNALRRNSQDALVRGHLIAFLSRFSLRVAWEVKKDLSKHGKFSPDTDAFFPDILQIALESALNPAEFFKNFDLEFAQGVFGYPALKKYALRKMTGIIIDRIRELEGMKTFKRSDLGLAVKATEKRVLDSLKYRGISPPYLTQYVLAWKCFQEVRTAGRVDISLPHAQNFPEIADRYNQLRSGLPLASEQNPAINGETIAKWLNEIGAAIRKYIDRPVESLDFSRTQDSPTLLEKLFDETTVLEDAAEIQERKEKAIALKTFIVNELEVLDSIDVRIPLLKNGLKLVQMQISLELDITQPTVGRRYQRLLVELLRQITQGKWQLPLGNEKPFEWSSEVLEIIKQELIEQFDDYYTNFIYANFQIALGNLSFSEMEVLKCQYILHLDTTAIAKKLQISEDNVAQIRQNAQETVKQFLIECIQNRLVLSLKPTGPAKEKIVMLTTEWFQRASY